jgi:hypothetical protein
MTNNQSLMVFDTQALISQAIEKNTPIETMERLLAMRAELKKEAARDLFFESLAGFQAACPVIKKNNPVYDKTGKLRYKYATLDDIVAQVKPYLLKFGFSYIIETIQDNNEVGAVCKAFHKMGHSEQSAFKVPIDTTAYMNVAQKVASALSFSKRYAFCDIFGIMTGTGDDDGNMTGEPGQQTINNNPQNSKSRSVTNSQSNKKDFNSAPDQNKGFYSAIMALIREKGLFIPVEKTENKKKADAVLFDYEKLKELYSMINKVAQERRARRQNNNK